MLKGLPPPRRREARGVAPSGRGLGRSIAGERRGSRTPCATTIHGRVQGPHVRVREVEPQQAVPGALLDLVAGLPARDRGRGDAEVRGELLLSQAKGFAENLSLHFVVPRAQSSRNTETRGRNARHDVILKCAEH